MKTLGVTRLNHPPEAKLVHTLLVFLISSQLRLEGSKATANQ